VNYGPPVHFQAPDLVVTGSATETLHLTMDVYVDVPTGPIDVTAFGMLFNTEPRGVLSLVDATLPSFERPSLFPREQMLVFFASPAASGHDGSAIGLYELPNGNVTIEPGSYGLFTLHVDVPPMTEGTFDLVFDVHPEYNGLAGQVIHGDDMEITIYPNIEGNSAVLATIAVESPPISTRLSGDVNNDGRVDGFDAAAFAALFGGEANPNDYDAGDFNGDGRADMTDMAILQENLGRFVDAGDALAGSPATVPEPSSVVLALCGAAALVVLRRRRS
jgi:hypothetical protein